MHFLGGCEGFWWSVFPKSVGKRSYLKGVQNRWGGGERGKGDKIVPIADYIVRPDWTGRPDWQFD